MVNDEKLFFKTLSVSTQVNHADHYHPMFIWDGDAGMVNLFLKLVIISPMFITIPSASSSSRGKRARASKEKRVTEREGFSYWYTNKRCTVTCGIAL